MPLGKIAPLAAALWAFSLTSLPCANAELLKFSGDIKIIPPQHMNAAAAQYVFLETTVPLKAADLFEYFKTVSPESTFSEFLAANPNLGTIEHQSPIDAGTVFVIPRPAPIVTDE